MSTSTRLAFWLILFFALTICGFLDGFHGFNVQAIWTAERTVQAK